MSVIVSLQFGNVYQRRAPGFVLLSRLYTSPYYLWLTSVAERASLNVEDPLLEGFVQGTQPTEFWIGLPDGTYSLSITCHEPLEEHGPFTVKANGVSVLGDVVIKAGSVRKESFQARSRDGILCLKFAPSAGKDFIINALVIEGPAGVRPQPVFKSAPPITLPDRKELVTRAGDADPKMTLRQICDWLIEHRRADGFMGGVEGIYAQWYTVSMPIRALLAGYDILADRRYLETALTTLDLFVDEQLPNGAFEGVFRGKATAQLSDTELEQSLKTRLPMSDIGSMVSALAAGSCYAAQPRKERYLKSVRHFCDDWAMKFQQPSGAFTDGQWFPDIRIYSCATAIEAATFSLAHAVTGNARYLKVAADAIQYLLSDWREDGSMVGRGPHWFVRSGQPFVLEPLYFGDIWYYDEGFITTSLHADDEAFRRRIDTAMGWRVFGARGLLQALEGKVWWPIQDTWDNAKSIGMVQTLLYARTHEMGTPALEEALADMRRFLCVPEYRRRLGIMPDDTEHPASVYGYQTWSGMSMESTGFAGMTLAEMIKPGVIYLDS